MNQEPRTRNRSAAGFTLIEILAALAVLIIGLASVIGILYSSFNEGRTASDRHAASILIPEAIQKIELDHLITPDMELTYGIPPDRIGMLIQTLSGAQESDKDATYGAVLVAGNPLKPQSAAALPNLNEWPRRPLLPQMIGERPYRVRYRLEKHPDWMPHDLNGVDGLENTASEFRGLYVLTVICYLDNEKDMSRPVQVSEPVVTYLRDRKNR